MFVLVFITLSILGSTHSSSTEEHIIRRQWAIFKDTHNKTYKTADEDEYRMTVFMKNWESIWKHNKLYELGLTTYWLGMNHFGDLTDDEFQENFLMPYNHAEEEMDAFEEDSQSAEEVLSSKSSDADDLLLPKTIDWRLLGAVTKVKNQGNCGACYAFSAIGSLESHMYLKTKKLVSLSEQNIIDCTYKTWQYRNKGCQGGNVPTTFRYIIGNRGIDTEKAYPYIAARHKRCLFNKTNIGANMTRFAHIRKSDERQLQAVVALSGPVSVMVDGSGIRFYSGGLYDNPHCSSWKYSHGMVVVGYGTYEKRDYWLVKNSYGSKWGENGYIIMSRNKKNQCAIATAAYYPVL